MICPWCGKDVNPQKLKSWSYASYTVSRYECKICGNMFNTYEREEKLKFTVPKIHQHNDND